MGVLPLQFAPGESAASLQLTGKELFHLAGVREAVEKGSRVKVRAAAADGSVKEFEAVPARGYAAGSRVFPQWRDSAFRAAATGG